MLPLYNAICNAVYPLLFFFVISALFIVNNLHISVLPLNDAACNGVYPSLSYSFTNAPFCINSSHTFT